MGKKLQPFDPALEADLDALYERHAREGADILQVIDDVSAVVRRHEAALPVIAAPRFGVDHPDRLTDLEEAMEPHAQKIVEAAIAAGYSSGEAIEALRALIENMSVARAENERTERAIASAKRGDV